MHKSGLHDRVRTEAEALLGSELLRVAPVSGGCISEAYRAHLADGRTVFIKANTAAPHGLFELEAEGLAWVAEANALPVPAVLGFGDEFLVQEFLAPRPAARDYDVQLGHGLAALHKFGAPSFGWHRDNFLATLVQPNTCENDWPTFYSERRLRPLLKRVVDSRMAPSNWSQRFEALFAAMPNLVGPAEPPARLHGDLWQGNLHRTALGGPLLIDPAVYGGHREIDLAMLALFGAPSASFYRAYDAVWPRSEGHERRVSLYQLYPLLAHVALFGDSYVDACERALAPWS